MSTSYCTIILAVGVTAALSSAAIAQESIGSLEDLIVAEKGMAIPTTTDVTALHERAYAALAAGDCATAAPLLNDLATQTNILANIIGQGVEPFYNAGSDARDEFRGRNSMNDLVEAESVANAHRAQRDEAAVREAQCLIKLGERDRAINKLYTALSRISTTQIALWEEARRLLWEQVGYAPPGKPGPYPVTPANR